MLACAAAAAVTAATPGTALAVHWPYFGGDAGRSGFQPVDPVRTPVLRRYSVTDAGSQGIVTPVITTAGGPDVQRIAYGTGDGPGAGEARTQGNVHVRRLADGGAVTPADGIDVDEGAGDTTFRNLGFVDTSTAAGLGQLLVVHNDAGAVEIAQVDEATGERVRDDIRVAGTDGFSVTTSPLATAPDSSGGRAVFFVAGSAAESRLFRVAVAGARSRDAAIGAVTSTGDIDAGSESSPALVFLNGSGGASPFLAVGTADGRVRTFAAGDLAEGPGSPVLAGGPDLEVQAQTPAVPVDAQGNPPTGGAPFLYVAVQQTDPAGESFTRVAKLRQSGGSLEAVSTSDPLRGDPAPGIAVTQQALAGGPNEGDVVVTTENNLYVLPTGSLRPRASLDPDDQLDGGTSGFARTTAASSGGLVFATRDNGAQLVLRLDDAQPVSSGEFTEDPANADAEFGFGQPSVSRGVVQYASNQGLFVYAGAGAPGAPGTGAGTGTGPGSNPRGARRRPRGLVVRVRPRRDRRGPRRFTTTGRLLLPSGLTRREACNGRISVQVKARRNTISLRRARLRRDCTFRSRVTFRAPRRFAGQRRLRFRVRFLSNDLLRPIQAREVRVRVR